MHPRSTGRRCRLDSGAARGLTRMASCRTAACGMPHRSGGCLTSATRSASPATTGPDMGPRQHPEQCRQDRRVNARAMGAPGVDCWSRNLSTRQYWLQQGAVWILVEWPRRAETTSSGIQLGTPNAGSPCRPVRLAGRRHPDVARPDSSPLRINVRPATPAGCTSSRSLRHGHLQPPSTPGATQTSSLPQPHLPGATIRRLPRAACSAFPARPMTRDGVHRGPAT